MNQETRRELIGRNLGIIPINHGQVYTFQIALPETEQPDLSLERYQAIERSLLQHQSNLISLVIRRTNAYADDDIEYELVYGADWLQVAKDLHIEQVWAWVFDMTDQQAQTAKAEMAQLAALPIPARSGLSSLPDSQPDSQDAIDRTHPPNFDIEFDIEAALDRKLKLSTDSIKQVLLASLEKFQENFEEKLRSVHYKLDQFSKLDQLSQNLSAIPTLLSQLENLPQQLATVQPKSSSAPLNFTGTKVDLRFASEQDIQNALEQIRTQDKQIQAALAAIRYWKQPGKELSWKNLERSSRAKPGSEYKIAHFADGTYNRLCTVGEITDSNSDE